MRNTLHMSTHHLKKKKKKTGETLLLAAIHSLSTFGEHYREMKTEQ